MSREDDFPLHKALDQGEGKEVVADLLSKYPDEIKKWDVGGYTPLHVALLREASTEVVELMLNTFPDAAKERDRSGSLPLDLAFWKFASVEVVDLLLKAYPGAVEEGDRDGNLPLHGAIMKRQKIEVIVKLMNLFPEGAKRIDNKGSFPLHLALVEGLTTEVLLMLLNAHPEAVKEKDEAGNLPLHIALANGVAREVVDMMMTIFPDATKEKNDQGRFPLHLILKRHAMTDMAEFILHANPEAVKERDVDGNYPFHLALSIGANAHCLEVILNAYPNVISMKNGEGMIPLECALLDKSVSIKVIDLILNADPLLLEQCCLSSVGVLWRVSEDIAQLLSRIYPDVAKFVSAKLSIQDEMSLDHLQKQALVNEIPLKDSDTAVSDSKVKLIQALDDKSVLRKSVLEGAFENASLGTWKRPTWKLLVFVSSTFTDTQHERNILAEKVLFQLRKEAKKHEIQVILFDMRTGIKDENTLDHRTWDECSRAIELCKEESMGCAFLSLQGDKYGYTPLPRCVDKDKLDSHVESLGCDDDMIQLVKTWYILDTNSVPPQYLLKRLESTGDGSYWDAYAKILPLLSGLEIDCAKYSGLLIGRSVTEWEVRAAFGDFPINLRECRCDSFLWNRRKLLGDLSTNRNYCDNSEHLPALLEWMQDAFDPSTLITYNDGISASDHATDVINERLGIYLSQFESNMKSKLSASLQDIVRKVGEWSVNSCGLGERGSEMTEYLHHCEWAHRKCSSFFGRELLCQSLLDMVMKPEKDRTGKFSGITACVVGLSGSGKTALMAKVAAETFSQLRKDNISTPVLLRFCGTSPGSRNARALMTSLCSQLEFLCELERKSFSSNDLTYDELVSYFHELLRDHPAVLFIDSLDQLSDENLGRSQISFLKGVVLNPDSRVIVSCLPNEFEANSVTGKRYLYLCETRLKESQVPRIEVKMSEENTIAESMLIVDNLLAKSGRALTAEQRAIIEQRASEGRDKTVLYLSLAVDVASAWTSSLGSDVALCEDVQSLIRQLLQILERDYGEKLVQAALGYITFSVKGVSDVEMEDLLSLDDDVIEEVFQYHQTRGLERMPSHVWLRLKEAFGHLIVEGQLGCMQFYHRQVKEMAESYLGYVVKLRVIENLAKYFGNLASKDLIDKRRIARHQWTIDGITPFSDKSVVNIRRCHEASNALLSCYMLVEAVDEICCFSGVCCKLRVDEGFQIIEDLLILVKKLHTRKLHHSMKKWYEDSGHAAELGDFPSTPIELEQWAHFKTTSDLFMETYKGGNKCVEEHDDKLLEKISQDYLRWLKSDIYRLRTSALKTLLTSAFDQPEESIVKKQAIAMWKVISDGNLHPKISLQLGRKLGRNLKFDPCTSILDGHMDQVNCVAYSPNGKHIISGCSKNTIRVWDSDSGECISILEGHSKKVTSVAFSQDGKYIFSGSEDKSIRIWDFESGVCISTLKEHKKIVTSIAASPVTGRIVSGSEDKTNRVWDLESGKCLTTIKCKKTIVTSVAYSPDGSYIVSGSGDSQIRVWDTESGKCLSTGKGHESAVNAVAYSPIGNKIVSGSADRTAIIWTADSAEILRRLQGHTVQIMSVAYSPDGKHVVSSSHMNIRIWDSESGACISVMKCHTHFITSVVYSPSGEFILSGSSDNTICVWDSKLCQYMSVIDSHMDEVSSVAFSFDGKYIVSGSRDNSVRVWNSYDGVSKLQCQTDIVYSVAFSHDGKFIAAGCIDSVIRVWDVELGVCVSTMRENGQLCVRSVAYSPNGKYIASGSDDKAIRVWDAETGKCVSILESDMHHAVFSVSYSQDGKYIVSGCDDCTVRMWEVQSRTCISTLQGHEAAISAVVFKPDGMSVASSSWDNTIRVWDFQSCECLLTLDRHTMEVNTIAYSPDGEYIVSGSCDKSIRLWKSGTGECILTLSGHTDFVKAVAFSYDGKQVVSGSVDKTVRVWDISSLVA